METMTGATVRLRPVREKDLAYLAQIKNDLRSQGWSQRLPPTFTPEVMAERIKKGQEDKNSALFAVETLEGTLLGTVNYSEGPPRLSATIGIAFGPEHWGKGHAAEAQEILLRFLFVERGVAVVRLWTQSANERAIRAAEKLGFRISARNREGVVNMERVADNLMMDILREEYFQSRGLSDNVKTGSWLG